MGWEARTLSGQARQPGLKKLTVNAKSWVMAWLEYVVCTLYVLVHSDVVDDMDALRGEATCWLHCKGGGAKGCGAVPCGGRGCPTPPSRPAGQSSTHATRHDALCSGAACGDGGAVRGVVVKGVERRRRRVTRATAHAKGK